MGTPINVKIAQATDAFLDDVIEFVTLSNPVDINLNILNANSIDEEHKVEMTITLWKNNCNYEQAGLQSKYKEYSKKVILQECNKLSDSEKKLLKLCSVSNSKLWEKLALLKNVSFQESINLKQLYENSNSGAKYKTILDQVNNGYQNFALSGNARVNSVFDYFYDNILCSKSFHKIYCEECDIHREFMKEGRSVGVCPYCGIEKLLINSIDIDHFLPKAHFPFLSIHSTNLIVSCSTCNNRIKKDRMYSPILHPFYDNIDAAISFSYQPGKIKIDNKGKDATENFIKLFKLEDRYNDELIIDTLVNFIHRYAKIVKDVNDPNIDCIISSLVDQIIDDLNDIPAKALEEYYKLYRDIFTDYQKNGMAVFKNLIKDYFTYNNLKDS